MSRYFVQSFKHGQETRWEVRVGDERGEVLTTHPSKDEADKQVKTFEAADQRRVNA